MFLLLILYHNYFRLVGLLLQGNKPIKKYVKAFMAKTAKSIKTDFQLKSLNFKLGKKNLSPNMAPKKV